MNQIAALHHEAMSLSDEAMAAESSGDRLRSRELFLRAFQREREAAGLVAEDLLFEPTRSVLHRSAASLAIDCGEYREAGRLIGVALAGNPPGEIAEELRDLLEAIRFRRHSTSPVQDRATDIAAGKERTGDTSTLEDLSVLARLREEDEG